MRSSDAVGGHTAPTALAVPRAHADAPLERPAARLQRDGAASFVTAWNELMDRIAAQTAAVA